MSVQLAFQQLMFLKFELNRLVNRRNYRWFAMWFGGSCNVIVSYRIDRALYLLIGKGYGILRPLFCPLFLFFRIFSVRHEISYKADIGKGLNVLHPSLGVVVSAKVVCRENLVLTGGELHWRTTSHTAW